MTQPSPKIEIALVAGFFVLGLLLRCWHLDLESVEHFDEGVYASVLWHDVMTGTPYPAREFYAPPMLSGLIDFFGVVPGVNRFAPFLPSLLFGSLSIIVFWRMARAWFGVAAGIFLAAVVAMSDFHIIYSRMALTDVTCLFWVACSVYVGTLAVARSSLRSAILSGAACGLAWWTKYTGWLPIAILVSGTSLWWIWRGRKSIGAIRTLSILATIVVSALATFAPWWWRLQAVGGYAAVSKNHAGYMHSLSSQSLSWATVDAWTEHLGQHLASQFWHDGMSGAISLGLGMLAAAWFRWKLADRSTGNADTGNSNQASPAGQSAAGRFPPRRIMVRFAVASIAMMVFSLRVWTPLVLFSLALGGLGGIFLWPVLDRAWTRRITRDLSPTAEGALPLSRGDLLAAPLVDPSLAYCITLAWFCGMLLVTPLYHPYARLFFPLLASVWLAAAGGVSWWLESNLSVARRPESASPAVNSGGSWGQRLLQSLLMVAVLTAILQRDEADELVIVSPMDLLTSELYKDRTSINRAAERIADASVLSSLGEWKPVRLSLSKGETISPRKVLEARSADAPNRELSRETREKQKLVVYGYGEPALLLHLAQAGLMVNPVSHLNLAEPDGSEPAVPTFLVIGPNAKRTPGFWEEWFRQDRHFELVTEVRYKPGDVSLLDLYTPKWLSQHPEVSTQVFELYRVR